MDLEKTVIQQVERTDKPLKQIAHELGFTHSRYVSAICRRHGIDLQARRGRINRIIAANAAAERKTPGLIDHDKRHAIQSWVSESMTGDGYSLYWLGRKWV